MNINKQYAWQRVNTPQLSRNLRGFVIGKSGCGKTTAIFNLLLPPGWLDYNDLYVFGKSLHQQEYKVLRKGLDTGLSKQQISKERYVQRIYHLLQLLKNLAVHVIGKMRADFYDDCQDVPDSSA